MAKKKRGKQATTSAPLDVKGGGGKSGRKVTLGADMGGIFGATPKKPEADAAPRTKAAQGRVKQARMARLNNKLI